MQGFTGTQSVYPVKYLSYETQPCAVERQRVLSGDEVSSVANLTGAAKKSFSYRLLIMASA